MEEYSLESDAFKIIEANLNNYLENFYSQKRQISKPASTVLKAFREDPVNIQRFLHEYEMGYIKTKTKNNQKLFFKTELSAEFQKYIIYISKFLLNRGPGLKPAYLIQGKNAEGAVLHAINNWLHYFNIPNKLKFNSKSLSYGGDGGYDFALGQYRFDVKHRDDAPGSGLILRKNFLDRMEDDVIIILATNATNIKLGTGFNKTSVELTSDEISKHLLEQEFPLAITGWITIGDFKNQAASRGSSNDAMVVDELNPISDLFMMIMSDQIDFARFL